MDEHTRPSEPAGHSNVSSDEQSVPWSAQITRAVAAQVRYWRDQRQLSAQQVADKTKDLGYHVPRSVIANLENGRRDIVTVAELLAFAAALDVPPAILIAPVGRVESLPILPSWTTSPWMARGWMNGAAVHPDYDSFSMVNWQEARQAIVLYDIHRALVREYYQLQNRLKRVAERGGAEATHPAARVEGEHLLRRMITDVVSELVYGIDRIRTHRSLIRSEGFVLPDLPAELTTLLREPVGAGEPSGALAEGSSESRSNIERTDVNELASFLYDLTRPRDDQSEDTDGASLG